MCLRDRSADKALSSSSCAVRSLHCGEKEGRRRSRGEERREEEGREGEREREDEKENQTREVLGMRRENRKVREIDRFIDPVMTRERIAFINTQSL